MKKLIGTSILMLCIIVASNGQKRIPQQVPAANCDCQAFAGWVVVANNCTQKVEPNGVNCYGSCEYKFLHNGFTTSYNTCVVGGGVVVGKTDIDGTSFKTKDVESRGPAVFAFAGNVGQPVQIANEISITMSFLGYDAMVANFSYELVDMTGQTVASQMLMTPPTNVNLKVSTEGLQAGIYNVKLNFNDEVVNKTILIQ